MPKLTDPDKVRNATMTTALSSAEAARVRARAKRWGMTPSAFLRAGALLLLKRKRKPVLGGG